MKITTRKDALAAGTTRYYSGRNCKHGHDSERYTSTGTCCTCLDEARMKEQGKFRELRAKAKAAADPVA